MQQHSKAVIAFEPNAAYATFLRRALSKVKVIEAAASDRKGHATIRIPYRSAVAGMGTIESSNTIHEPFHEAVIETLLLNSLQLPTVGFMKIDVEGHELAALVGATDILERDRPNLLIEAENRHRPNAVESVAEFLAGYGYDGFFYFDKSLLPISRFDMSTFQSLDETTHDYSGPYVNNFIFVQPEGIKSLQSVLARADWL
jgi:FkbM family methyltransferase